MKLEHANLSESVYREIRMQLMDGEHPPGARLRIAELAEGFGVSITPVREAIFRLVSDGALAMRAATAVHVPELTADPLREIQLARILLEGACAERAAALADSAAIATLERIHRDYIEAWKRTPMQASRLNREFHFVLAQTGRMPTLFGMIERLWVMMGPVLRRFHADTAPRRIGLASHRHNEVIAALKRRDGPMAREAIQADIRWSDIVIDWVARNMPRPPVGANGDRKGEA